MTANHDALRAAALASIAEGEATGERWPTPDDWFAPEHDSTEMAFIRLASPATVVALLDTIAQLVKHGDHLRNRRRYWIAESTRIGRLLDASEGCNTNLRDSLSRIHFRCTSFFDDERPMPVTSVESVMEIAARALSIGSEKVCVECNRPHCHGVCVERGDDKEPSE